MISIGTVRVAMVLAAIIVAGGEGLEICSFMKRNGLEWEWKEVIRGLDVLQQVEANFQGRRFLFRSQLTAHASQAVRATGVAIPHLTLRELQ